MAEFDLKGSADIEPLASDCQSISVPGGRICWDAPSQLAQVSTCAGWTVFLWGWARKRDENDAKLATAEQIALKLSQGEQLKPILVELDGRFGVLVWNAQTRELQAATDPVGLCRVFYASRAGKICASSHLQMIARRVGDLSVSPAGLSILLSLNGVTAPYTVFECASALRPSELMTCSMEGCVNEDYWNLPNRIVPYQGSFEDAQADFERLLDDLLRGMAQFSQGQIGVSMSGGVDSALIATLAARSGVAARALTVGYNPPTRYDETQSAQDNTRLIGLPIEVVRVSDQQIAETLTRMLARLHEPLGDATVLPQLIMTASANPVVTSLIDGTGADNIFGGMMKFSAEHYARRYLRIPKFLRINLIRPLLNVLPSSRRFSVLDQVRRMQKFAAGVELPETLQKVYWSRFLPHEIVKRMISDALKPDPYLADQVLLGLRGQVPSQQDDFLRSTYASLRGTMPVYATQKLGAIQYASGATIYLPFTSSRMIEFALSLPVEYKLAGGSTKLVLRAAASKLLPAECVKRRKANFSPPIGRWLTGVFREEFGDLLANNRYFNREMINKMLAEQTSGWRDWQWQLWTVFVFLKWMREVSE